jgi:hypothetical protein
MKFRMNLSWYIVGLLLLAPAANAEDKTPEADSARQEVAAPAQGQILEKDEPFDDGGSPPVTQSELQGVRNEVQVLRDQWQRGIDRTVVSTKRYLSISGTGQLKYTGPNPFLDDSPSGVKAFSIPFFGLNFKGNLRKDYEEGKNLDYTLGIQTTGASSISITEANLTYQIFNSLDKEGPRLSITGGQQKKYFGNEATATEEFKPTIAGAQFASKLSLDSRDIGFVLAGDLLPSNDYGTGYRVPLVQYWLGAINGSGPNTAEINNEKDLFARLQFNAPVDYNHPLRGLSFGLSGYKGWQNYTATNTTTNTVTVNANAGAEPPVAGTPITASTNTATISRKGDKERWGVDLAYVNTPVGFTLEYVRGRDLASTNGTIAKKDGVTKTVPYAFKAVDEEGYTFTVFYNFGEQFVNSIKTQDSWNDYYPLTYQPFVRFDRWIPDSSSQGDRTDIWTVGFNWFFAETTKFQVNYNITRDYKLGQPVKNSDAILAQFQFGF